MSARPLLTVVEIIAAHRALVAQATAIVDPAGRTAVDTEKAVALRNALDEARQRVLEAPCMTLEDARTKVRYLLEDKTDESFPLFGGHWYDQNTRALKAEYEERIETFIRSLLGPGSLGELRATTSTAAYLASGALPVPATDSMEDAFAGVPLTVSSAIAIHHALELHERLFFTNDTAGVMIGDPEEELSSESALSFVWLQFVKAPCLSFDDVRAKAAYFLFGLNGRKTSPELLSLLDPNHGEDTSGRYTLATFFRSMLGVFPVEDPRASVEVFMTDAPLQLPEARDAVR